MSIQVCTFFPDFPEEPSQTPLTLAFTTESQAPYTVVPVFLIHSLESPFCDNPRCICQQQRQQKAALLVSVRRGELILRQEGGTR